jgi:hypothetical protein
MKKVILAVLSLLLLTAGMAAAEESSWLEISGDYRFRFDSLKGDVKEYLQIIGTGSPMPATMPVNAYTAKNNSIMMNRFGLNLKANPMEDVTVKARLLMYKVWGHQSADPALDGFFADRFAAFGVHDGIAGHVPQDSILRADYAYATVSNVFDLPLWVSVGRRPSTEGIPSTYRQNQEKTGTAGIPSLMVNYAFDGFTIGYAPDIEALPGAYAKFCAGRGFDSGFRGGPNDTGIKDTDFYGLNAVPYDTEKLHVELQYQIGNNIFDRPSDGGVTTNLGDIDWYGGVVTTKMGNLNLFASAAVSTTDPNDNTTSFDVDGDGTPDAMAGLGFNFGSPAESHTGNAFYVGARYDMSSTKIGVEYNQGSKHWIGMVPAEDDIWTSKLGTRGSVYEVYIIQELKRKAVSKRGKAFVRLGYQYYDFKYTGSNNWIGEGAKIDNIDQDPMNMNAYQLMAPLDKAQDIYATFDVQF